MEIRDIRNCNWYWMDKVVYEKAKEIGIMALAVYNGLCYHANSGTCYPSIETIAVKLGASVRSISRALNTLEQASLIKIESGAASGSPNIYTLLPLGGYDTTALGVGHQSTRGVGHQSTTNNNNTTRITNNKNNASINTKNNNEIPPAKFDFELAYSKYPRKLGRAKAMQHFEAQVKTAKDFDDLLLAIENYKADIIVRSTEEQYIKHAATFFNQNWRDWANIKPVVKQEVKRYQEL
jgi:hypothetical protein